MTHIHTGLHLQIWVDLDTPPSVLEVLQARGSGKLLQIPGSCLLPLPSALASLWEGPAGSEEGAAVPGPRVHHTSLLPHLYWPQEVATAVAKESPQEFSGSVAVGLQACLQGAGEGKKHPALLHLLIPSCLALTQEAANPCKMAISVWWGLMHPGTDIGRVARVRDWGRGAALAAARSHSQQHASPM